MKNKLKSFPFYTYTGILLLVFMLTCLIFNISNITVWATPVLWIGLILLLDGILFKYNRSIIKNFKIIPLNLLSIIWWWIFEWFNIFLSNWKYTGLVDSIYVKYFGYFISFATIFPGVLLIYSLILKILPDIHSKQVPITQKKLTIFISIGLFFLFIPIIPFSMNYLTRSADPELFIWLSQVNKLSISQYTAGFIWLAFIFLFEPINYLSNKPSIISNMIIGNYKKLVSILLAGLISGLLWESWNYWAATKWYYTVPILPQIKIFEMPILGYIGFLAFAWEIYSITSFYLPDIIHRLENEK